MKVIRAIHELSELLSVIYPADEARSIAQYYFECVTGKSRYQLSCDRDMETDVSACEKDIQRLLAYEPVQYVTGISWFYGMPLKVYPGVLIPRPETEELVKTAIEILNVPDSKAIDIGTGSGCIAVALKKNRPDLKVFASDVSEIALKTAGENAATFGTEIQFIVDNVLQTSLTETFGLMISNPPYVTEREKAAMRKNVTAYEPDIALYVADHDPLLFYRAITAFAVHSLKSGGHLLFEINEAFPDEICDLLKSRGFINIEARKDINGKWRIVKAQKP